MKPHTTVRNTNKRPARVVGGTPSSRAHRRYTRALRAAYPDGGPQAPTFTHGSDALRAATRDYRFFVAELECRQLRLALTHGEHVLEAARATVAALVRKQRARRAELKRQEQRLKAKSQKGGAR